jgi:membrane protease YdiL (CAAX protease family)
VLSKKPWKLEAIARLLIGVFICMCLGSLFGTALYPGTGFQKHKTLFFFLSAVALVLLAAALFELGKAWTLENFRRRVGIFFLCFYPGLTLLACAQHVAGPPVADHRIGQMLISLASMQGGVLLLTGRMLRQERLGVVDAFGISNGSLRAIAFGALVAGIFLEVGNEIQSFCHYLLSSPHSPIKPVEQQAVETLRTATSWTQRVVAGIFTIGLAPVGEETLFRGILYPTIKQAGFPKLAVWATSIAFAVIHLNVETFLPLLVLALLLTLLYEKTNNLLAPITAHAVFNAMQFINLYIQEHQKQMQ